MPFTLTPDAKFIGFDDNGVILSGGKLYTYAAGTSTPLATFSDSAGTANTNPVILDSAGRAVVYLQAFSYKFVLKNSSDVQIWSQDNISDAALTSVAGSIVGTTDVQTLTNKTLNVPTINFGTLNSVTINNPAVSNPVVSSGTFTAPSISAPIFTSKVQFVKRVQYAKGANVASAAILTLGDDGNVFAITGGAVVDYITTTNWQAGSPLILIFTSVVQLNHGSSSPPAGTAPMLLHGGTNYGTTNPTVMTFVFDGTNWQEVSVSVNHL